MWSAYLEALALILAMGAVTWSYSLYRRDVSIVDSLWSLMFLAAALLFAWRAPEINLRTTVLLGLVAIWAIRLSAHLTVRNWGQPEDRRYQAIRRNNEPNFGIKSLYIVFGLQGMLAWTICVPLLVGLYTPLAFHWLDVLGISLWLVGFAFEAVADQQLTRFKANPANAGKVLDTGLWRYSRHPNYFGEFLIWWGFYLFALPAGGWWTVYAPLLMSFLLLKVSGVVLMEKDIDERRPAYRAYVARTSAFFPWPPTPAMPRAREEYQQ